MPRAMAPEETTTTSFPGIFGSRVHLFCDIEKTSAEAAEDRRPVPPPSPYKDRASNLTTTRLAFLRAFFSFFPLLHFFRPVRRRNQLIPSTLRRSRTTPEIPLYTWKKKFQQPRRLSPLPRLCRSYSTPTRGLSASSSLKSLSSLLTALEIVFPGPFPYQGDKSSKMHGEASSSLYASKNLVEPLAFVRPLYKAGYVGNDKPAEFAELHDPEMRHRVVNG